MLRQAPVDQSRGTSLIEVLVTLVILAVGLLGVAGLQSKMGVAEVESYQREQALLTLTDMVNRIYGNSAQAASYVTATPLGTGDSQPATCAGIAAGPALDQCQWSQLLKGTSEQTSGTTNVAVPASVSLQKLTSPSLARSYEASFSRKCFAATGWRTQPTEKVWIPGPSATYVTDLPPNRPSWLTNM